MLASDGLQVLATVATSSDNGSGSVAFYEGKVFLGFVRLDSARTASLPIKGSTGPHAYVAIYSGDLHNSSSTSMTLEETLPVGSSAKLQFSVPELMIRGNQSGSLTVSAASLTTDVSLTCETDTPGLSCDIAPAMLTSSRPEAIVTVRRSGQADLIYSRNAPFGTVLGLGLLAGILFTCRTGAAKRIFWLAAAAAILALATSCGTSQGRREIHAVSVRAIAGANNVVISSAQAIVVVDSKY